MQMPEPNPPSCRARRILSRACARCCPRAVIDDVAETRAYECDALSAYKCPPMAVILPGSTHEVSRALAICHEMGVPVVPRGAGTSLAGGRCPPPTA